VSVISKAFHKNHWQHWQCKTTHNVTFALICPCFLLLEGPSASAGRICTVWR
jgi:hypothetical protein